MTTMVRKGNMILLNGKEVAIWTRGSWYQLVRGEYEAVTDPEKIGVFNGVPRSRRTAADETAAFAASKIATIDKLKIIGSIRRKRDH